LTNCFICYINLISRALEEIFNMCPNLNNCPIFNMLQSRSDFLWVKNFCHYDHIKCSRQIVLNNNEVPAMNLLPNGGFFSFKRGN